ncbi:unnamed protein product [Rotaria socialis]|uniref:Uncharacterized protein n=1 Tax=Rotaria socialis TaxID=392032 RepID=A0A818NCX7_9BILA|nr:unnamed protein product [Rotaria socialis]
MICFGLLTLFNIRSRFIRRIEPSQKTDGESYKNSTLLNTNLQPAREARQRDKQSIQLALYQGAIFTMLNTLWSLYPLYAFVLLTAPSISFEQILILGIWEAFGLNLLSIYAAITLILYTLVLGSF